MTEPVFIVAGRFYYVHGSGTISAGRAEVNERSSKSQSVGRETQVSPGAYTARRPDLR